MSASINSFINNSLAQMAQRAGPRITGAIQSASARTGVDFAYLMEKAAAESSFNASAKARTSSATGLYQFIESTWLQMVRDHGAKYGLGDYARQIDARGRVGDQEMRQEILALRNDPEAASYLAAEFAAGNQRYLERHLGTAKGEIGATELYLAHFMGAGGATAFLKAHNANPLAAAADLFPQAARANRNVFYDRQTGQPRSLAAVYDFFDKKFSGGPASGSAPAPLQAAQAAHITPPRKPPAAIPPLAAALRPAAPFAAEAARQQQAASASGESFHRRTAGFQRVADADFAAAGSKTGARDGRDGAGDALFTGFYRNRILPQEEKTYSFAAGHRDGVASAANPSPRGAIQPAALLFLAQLEAPGNREERGNDAARKERPEILAARSPLFLNH